MSMEITGMNLPDWFKVFCNRMSYVGKDRLCISLWHEFHKPPYGGGNQFMLALKKGLEQRGVLVVTNTLSPKVDVHRFVNDAVEAIPEDPKLAKKGKQSILKDLKGKVFGSEMCPELFKNDVQN